MIRRSLKTKVLSVAKLKLADLEKEERSKLENVERIDSGTAIFSDLVSEYRTRLEANHSIKSRTRESISNVLRVFGETYLDLDIGFLARVRKEPL